MSQSHPNSLLKAGCLLFIIGGILSCAVTVGSYLISMGGMLNVDEELYEYIDQTAQAQSGGMMGGQEVMGFLSGLIFVMCAIAVVMLIINLIVGFLGLRRYDRPEKYRFFQGWGIALVIIGVLGTLLTGITTLPALVSLLSGVVAPILYIVGARQQADVLRQASMPQL